MWESPKFLPGVIKKDPTNITPNTPRRVLLRPVENGGSPVTRDAESNNSTDPILKRDSSQIPSTKPRNSPDRETLLKPLLKNNKSEEDSTRPSNEKSKKAQPHSSPQETQEPEYICKIKADVKTEVLKLMREQKISQMQRITSFFMKDSKGSYAKPTYIKLSHNHQVLQFGEPSSIIRVDGGDVQLPLRIMVSNISLVEDHTERANGGNASSENKEHHIWFFDKVHREGWELITNCESDFTSWLNGLRTLIGLGTETAETLQLAKELTEISIELKLWEKDVSAGTITRMNLPSPRTPKQLTDFNFCTNHDISNSLEHWKICDIIDNCTTID